MNRQLGTALAISISIHIAAVVCLVFCRASLPETAYGAREYVVAVDVISEDGNGDGKKGASAISSDPATRGEAYSSDTRKQTAGYGNGETDVMARSKGGGKASPSRKPSLPRPHGAGALQTDNDSGGGGGKGGGLTGDGGTNKTLARIKARIEAVRIYPRLAQKMEIEGRPAVIFEINPDGSIKYVHLTASSGNNILDRAAIATITRSAPLPYYENPIHLAIRYELH